MTVFVNGQCLTGLALQAQESMFGRSYEIFNCVNERQQLME